MQPMLEPSSGLPKHDLASFACDVARPSYGRREECQVRELVCALIPERKAFSYETGTPRPTLDCQLNGARAVSVRLAFLAQARAGEFPVQQYLDGLLGAATVRVPAAHPDSREPYVVLAEASAEMGRLSGVLARAADAHMPGGVRITRAELAEIERDAWAVAARVRQVAMTAERLAAVT